MPDRKHDWEIIGARDPFFGVLTSPDFRLDQVDAATRQRFYASGDSEMQTVLGWFDTDLGARPAAGTALDIGCGVGRLTHAIARHVAHATGYDVSESMIRLAREGAPPNTRFTTELPAGPFDWINSYIVFQHIPPAEGLALLSKVLSRAAPGAFASIHFTAWNDAPSPRSLLARLTRWRTRRVQRQDGHDIGALIQMHAYNFSDVMKVFVTHGFGRLVLRHTDHGGHHGAWVIARRAT
jgi:SAM-dependent methyltransferase